MDYGKTDIYVPNILNMLVAKAKLDAKGGQVVNRDEILRVFYAETNEYITNDFHIEADLEMLVMGTMAALGGA